MWVFWRLKPVGLDKSRAKEAGVETFFLSALKLLHSWQKSEKECGNWHCIISLIISCLRMYCCSISTPTT